MDERDTLPFLEGLQRTGIRPGLARIRRLLARLGHPERDFPSVLIAGTNGKGSTAAFVAAILGKAGWRVGLFTSPHLVDVRERVVVGGAPLSREQFEGLGAEVRAAGVRVTYFEALTAVGFLAFAREKVDVAVVEVGMGGRLDSTNTLSPCVSVLTNVSSDHTRYLGETLDAIAREKVEVARPRRPFVTAVAKDLYERVVGPRLLAKGARPLRLGRDFHVERHEDGTISWRGLRMAISRVRLSLRGTFQAENAACALAVVEALGEFGLGASEAAMLEGLSQASWPGRMQVLDKYPLVVVDGCHNEGAAARLRETLLEDPLPRPMVMVHASKPDKDYRTVLAQLAPLCDAVVETTIPGLCDIETVLAACRAFSVPVKAVDDPMEAIRVARAMAGREGSVLVTGSLYLVGHVLRMAGANFPQVPC